MKPSISVIAAARRFLAIPPRSSHVLSGKRSDSAPIPDGSSFLLGHLSPSSSSFLSLPSRPLSSLCEGMLTRCLAPTFMEMHPLIYPGSACSRLCLTSVLREVYYLTARDLLALFFPFPFVQSPPTPVTSPPLAFTFRPFHPTFALYRYRAAPPSTRLTRIIRI